MNSPRAAGSHGIGFRADIQGLRAIAVLLVVVYHIWPKSLTGGYVGVDVFFVISGFLMTALLLRRPPRRRADFAAFWARRVRRLLPAALLVILATVVVGWLVAPSPLWLTTARQALACTFYVQNWILAATSVNYLAADDAPSPLLHYWSLSVEEQFYLLWPILIAIAVFGASRRGRPVRVPVLTVVCAVLAASLAISWWYTSAEPAAAYFITPTRMWELALGGLVAALPRAAQNTLPAPVRAAIAWLGIAAIVVTGLCYTDATPVPGLAALLPTVGTAAVLWAQPAGAWSPAGPLGLRPVQYLGDVSYSLYLWHWPLIAVLPYIGGSLGFIDRCAILVASLVLAGVTKVVVEDPLRRPLGIRPTLNAYRLGAIGMVVLGLVGVVWLQVSTARVQAAAHAAEVAAANAGPCFGAASLDRGFAVCQQDPSVTPVPAPEAAKLDKSKAYADNCWSYEPFVDHPTCTYGTGPVKVALVGNSHAGHWLPALTELAKTRGWTITTYLISECAPSFTRQQFDTPDKSRNCFAYGQWALDKIRRGHYDLIITSNRVSVRALGQSWAQSGRSYTTGFRRYLRSLAAGEAPVVVLHDLPYPGRTVKNIPDCLAQHLDDVTTCAGTPVSWRWYYPFAAAAKGLRGVNVIDLTRYFCTSTTCPAVIGGVTVYFDSSHMTATYAKTLAPYLGNALDRMGNGVASTTVDGAGGWPARFA